MNTKWGIWVIGEDWRGDPAGHWYKISPTSMARGFDSKAKAERHKTFCEGVAENQGRDHKYSVEEFEDEHTAPESLVKTPNGNVLRKPQEDRSTAKLLDSKPKVWKKGM